MGGLWRHMPLNLIFMFIGVLLTGVGNCAFYTFGVAYLDDNTSHDNSPLFQTNNVGSTKKLINANNKLNWDEMERRIDKWTFISSSTFILIFNIVYWFTALV